MSSSPPHEEDSDDDVPQLSAHTLAALQEFYAERLLTTAESDQPNEDPSTTRVEEDWQLSQFWYDERTAQVLAEEALDASQNKKIACVSCPTLYSKLVSMKPSHCQTILLEYDRRFQRYDDDFVFYDYNHPLDLPQDIIGPSTFDLVVVDPPYLSEECLRKTAETVKFLAKDKVLLCTGAVMEELAYKLLGVRKCMFVPTHARNLGNEFLCYANYDSSLNKLEGTTKLPVKT